MMSFQSLNAKLLALEEENVQIRALVDRLANLKFQPGSVPFSDFDDNVKEELAGEIIQTIRDQEDDLDYLMEEVLDLNEGRYGSELELQRDVLHQGVQRAMAELKQITKIFHRAQTTAQRSLEKAQRMERLLLVRAITDPKRVAPHVENLSRRGSRTKAKQELLSRDEKSIHASTDVTLALRRTHAMMASELSRSQFAHDTLKESTLALAELGETYSVLDTLLSSSKNLLGTLLRSQKSDTWYLETAFYVLAATIAWLVFRRLLYGPTWWLIYLPLKMVFNAWVGVFTAVGILGGSRNSVAISSSIGGETSLAGSIISASIVGSSTSTIISGTTNSASSARETDNADGQESISEQVGRIIDESQSQRPESEEAQEGDTKESEDAAELQPNPKKRMWEEKVDPPNEAPRKKDEL